MERSSLADELGADRDQVVLLHNVSWETYKTLREARGSRRPRMAFLDGTLELMTTGVAHELDKALLRRLLEAYAEAMELQLNTGGSPTFEHAARKVGVEPDECFWIGAITEFPQLAVEVVHTHSDLDKLEIFRRLGVAEVWRFVDGAVEVHVLVEGRYKTRARSAVIRGIDLAELARICDPANYETQTATVRAYRQLIARRRRKSTRS